MKNQAVPGLTPRVLFRISPNQANCPQPEQPSQPSQPKNLQPIEAPKNTPRPTNQPANLTKRPNRTKPNQPRGNSNSNGSISSSSDSPTAPAWCPRSTTTNRANQPKPTNKPTATDRCCLGLSLAWQWAVPCSRTSAVPGAGSYARQAEGT